jgi:hypothetical protein
MGVAMRAYRPVQRQNVALGGLISTCVRRLGGSTEVRGEYTHETWPRLESRGGTK